MDNEVPHLINELTKLPSFEVRDFHFDYIWSTLNHFKTVSFNFCPNEQSQFGVVLSLISGLSKLTTEFLGLHPSIHEFLFISLPRHGGFAFSLESKDLFSVSYVSEKLGLPEEDANGFCEMLNYFISIVILNVARKK